ncbi:MAG: hypothetical protein HOP29_13480 [Phycisphaerales bacterium]|nr:hypothetical protein [Phycisphaerales bacterium]
MTGRADRIHSRRRRRRRGYAFLALVCTASSLAGCIAPSQTPLTLREELVLRDRCVEVVKQAVRYTEAGSVRAAGIEVMQRHCGAAAIEWFRSSLQDPSPGVRFAALIALGMAGDADAREWVLPFADDADAGVRLSALYALHRLGDTGRTGEFASMMLRHDSADVRRDAAFLLGILDETGAAGLLARAMTDRDEGIRRQALESMARLGNEEAVQQLVFWSNSGLGPVRVRALNALARLRRPSLAATFQYSLESGEYLEVRLAAAAALGRLGRNDGFALAAAALTFNEPRPRVPGDPPAEQIMRVRQLAAVALGAIGDRHALGALRRTLESNSDPRVQLAAADAVLEIVGGVPDHQSPFAGNSPAADGRGGS